MIRLIIDGLISLSLNWFDVTALLLLHALLMPVHSKVAQGHKDTLLEILQKAFLGSAKKQAFSAVLLAIIGYLIYIKNKKSSTDHIKLGEPSKSSKVRSP